MKNSTIFMGLVLLVLLVGGFVFVNGFASKTSSVNGNIIQGQSQQVILSQDGYNYKDIVAEAGKPIEISADSSVVGCLRSAVFNIEGKRYSKYLKSSQDTLQLPALSKGTYTFTCSMGMGYGKLVVN